MLRLRCMKHRRCTAACDFHEKERKNPSHRTLFDIVTLMPPKNAATPNANNYVMMLRVWTR